MLSTAMKYLSSQHSPESGAYLASIQWDGVHTPPGAEEVYCASEEVIVQDATIHRVHAHQKDDVASKVERLENL